MKIINRTKNTLLAENAVLADTLLKRTKGLLGTADFKPGEAMVITSCNSIHTFFMHFPIDVLFVDKNYRIIKVLSSLKPFRISPLYFNANFVVELPTGTTVATSTTQGDCISLE
jgi:uncharacterized membrane protein (UPF0127 family)